jgi:hypothetical protein
MGAPGRARWAFGLTVTALAWCTAIVVAAFTVPVYSSGATLSAENGTWIALPVAAPAALVALAWIALHRRCSRASRAGTRLAWSSIGLLVAFGLLAAASIGLFLLPAAVLLATAASLTPRPTVAR